MYSIWTVLMATEIYCENGQTMLSEDHPEYKGKQEIHHSWHTVIILSFNSCCLYSTQLKCRKCLS